MPITDQMITSHNERTLSSLADERDLFMLNISPNSD